MTERVIRNGKGEDVGARTYIAHDGRALAEYYPAMEERKRISEKTGREIVVQRARKAKLAINSNRIHCGKGWWEKSYLERAKPEYKEEIEELLKKYEGVVVTEYLNL